MATYPDFSAHATDDREASGEVLTQIEAQLRQALPAAWSQGVTWAHTGGGCSGWEILYRDETGKVDETRGGFLLTGASDETEASGDLSRGVVVGYYGSSPFEGDDHYGYVYETVGTPQEIAAAVLKYVAGSIEKLEAIRAAVEPAIEAATGAFWQAIAAGFPMVTTGDVDPLRVKAFEEAAREALEHWLSMNAKTDPEA